MEINCVSVNPGEKDRLAFVESRQPVHRYARPQPACHVNSELICASGRAQALLSYCFLLHALSGPRLSRRRMDAIEGNGGKLQRLAVEQRRGRDLRRSGPRWLVPGLQQQAGHGRARAVSRDELISVPWWLTCGGGGGGGDGDNGLNTEARSERRRTEAVTLQTACAPALAGAGVDAQYRDHKHF